MRIADTMVFEQTRENLGTNRSKLAHLQNKAATQKRVTKPSDDPVAAARVLASRIDLSGQKQYLKNLNYAKSFLDFTDQSLGELSELLIRAKELVLGQASDASSNTESRRVVGTEVAQLFRQSVNIGNRKLGDRYIFGGYKTTTPPFSSKGQYEGDKGEILIHVNKDSFMAMNIPGSKVFGGEGLTNGGAGHVANVQAKTVEALKEQQLQKKQATDQKNDPGYDSVSLRGPASVGGSPGSTESEAPQSKGVESEDSGDGQNLFVMLQNLEISLMADDKAGIQDSIDELDSAINQVVLSRSHVGARVTAIDNTFESLQKAKVDSQTTISQLEDADIYELVSDITKTESALQATLSTSAKILQPSLLDFLR